MDVRNPSTFVNFRQHEETVFIIHGFNGTARDKHMRYLKDGNIGFFFFILTVVPANENQMYSLANDFMDIVLGGYVECPSI